MKSIWKFPLKLSRIPVPVQIPKGSKFLDVQIQAEPCMWFEVDTEAAPEQRWFYIVGTGGEVPRIQSLYLGTFQAPPYVWHVYEVDEPWR